MGINGVVNHIEFDSRLLTEDFNSHVAEDTKKGILHCFTETSYKEAVHKMVLEAYEEVNANN
jgi:hypothetical protein